MNLPFGLPVIKENVVKKKEKPLESVPVWEHKLAEYRETLEYYKNCLLDYYSKLKEYDKKAKDNQLALVQAALDLTYMKEQDEKMLEILAQIQVAGSGNKTLEFLKELKEGPIDTTLHQLEGIVAAIIDTNLKLEGLDKNVVSRLSELMLELQRQSSYETKQLQMELMGELATMKKSIRRSNALLGFVIAFNIIAVSALAFLILYTLKIIPISI